MRRLGRNVLVSGRRFGKRLARRRRGDRRAKKAPHRVSRRWCPTNLPSRDCDESLDRGHFCCPNYTLRGFFFFGVGVGDVVEFVLITGGRRGKETRTRAEGRRAGIHTMDGLGAGGGAPGGGDDGDKWREDLVKMKRRLLQVRANFVEKDATLLLRPRSVVVVVAVVGSRAPQPSVTRRDERARSLVFSAARARTFPVVNPREKRNSVRGRLRCEPVLRLCSLRFAVPHD